MDEPRNNYPACAVARWMSSDEEQPYWEGVGRAVWAQAQRQQYPFHDALQTAKLALSDRIAEILCERAKSYAQNKPGMMAELLMWAVGMVDTYAIASEMLGGSQS